MSDDVRIVVRVLCFAAAREVVGADEVRLSVTTPADVAAVRRALFAEHPGLAPYARSLRFAVNGAYARDDDAVVAGDEVAAIPPVAGG